MKLKSIWEESSNSIDTYMTKLEFYDMTDKSILFDLRGVGGELYTGDGYAAITNQTKYGDECVDMYAIGGVASFDIFSNHQEYVEYKQDMKNIKRLLNKA